MKIGKYRAHFFKSNERGTERGRQNHIFAMRYFLHIYKMVFNAKYLRYEETNVWEGHAEVYIRRRKAIYEWFAARFHIGNKGSETPWDGHLSIGPFSIFWGHSGFRRLAHWLTLCEGYAWDTRDWKLSLSDSWTLRWEIANHDQMCDVHRNIRQERAHNRGKKRRRRSNSLREGHVNLNIPDHIWGPVRYSYEDVAHYQTLLKFPDGEYAVILTLQRMFKGRTKVAKQKHEMSWHIDVEAPRGVPTHYDHSGGWKGDRSYGWGVAYPDAEGNPDLANTLPLDWEDVATHAVEDWVQHERDRTGFKEPQKEEK